MNEGLLEISASVGGPVEEDMEVQQGLKPTNDALTEKEYSTEVEDIATEKTSEVLDALASSDSPEKAPSAPLINNGQTEMISGATADEPPVDWFEPLEDDDDDDDDTQGWNAGAATGERRVNGKKDAEEESVAGSERSGSVAGSERNAKKNLFSVYRRKKKVMVEEGWEEWPVLGEGWKRKAVVRRSGSSVGQSDVYYMSPTNERVRSRVELSKVLAGTVDLTMFDYKAGMFRGAGQPKPLRGRKKNKRTAHSPLVDGGFSSESSLIEKGDRADSPESRHRLTPVNRSATRTPHFQHKTPTKPNSTITSINSAPVAHEVESVQHSTTKLSWSPSSSLSVSINGKSGSKPCFCICAVCGNSYTGFEYERHMKVPCCPKCRANSPVVAKSSVYRRFRKWIPCGNCRACLTTEDCGNCANCKKALNPDSRNPARCRKRKCLCPIRKHEDDVSHPMTNIKLDSGELQSLAPQYSDPEDFSVNVDIEDDDEEFDGDDADYEAWVKKRKRRSCGNCEACNSRTDCGTCDFCIDKPKFGGSNKKRQKCRLRQCQRQAMRHLLPFQLGQTDFGSQEGWVQFGRPRPHFTYSRKTTPKKSKTQQLVLDLEFFDDEDDLLHDEEDERTVETAHWRPLLPSSSKPQDDNFGNHLQTIQVYKEPMEIVKKNGLLEAVPSMLHQRSSPAYCTIFKPVDQQGKYARHSVEGASMPPAREGGTNGVWQSVDKDVEMLSGEQDIEVTPMITQIFSLAESAGPSGMEQDHELMKLLEYLRSSTLPTLWFAIMVEGPMLQLLQCSKLSHMVDTTLHIDQSFCYQICVQGQPLLLTHSLYEAHPSRLTTVTQVVDVLLDLEKYNVCQGVPTKEQPFSQAPVIIERASTCDFLVLKETEHCEKCTSILCG
ncbi:hypothetical protein UPYG_G00172980 [Umbra pygmaea]|uniref:Methyl-CpG-binding domain protein 1b n=1 Tax=Umbra pygmaea TaxID=75934 RepID=A0ABD0WPE9_UMBPY